MYRILILILVLLIAAGLSSCREETITAEQVTETLDSLELKLDWITYRIGQESWEARTEGRSDSLDFYQRLRDHVVSDKRAYSILMRGRNLIKDDLDRRRLSMLRRQLMTGIVENSRAVVNLRDSVMISSALFTPIFEGQRTARGDVSRILSIDPNGQRREMAFRAINEFGAVNQEGVAQLFRIRNQQARKLGYNSFYAMTFDSRALKLQDYLKLLKEVDSLTRGSYETLLGELRTSLSNNDLEIWDVTYAHADVRSQVDRYFTADNQVDMVEQGLEEIGFDLSDLPIYYLENSPEGVTVDDVSYSVRPPFDQRAVVTPSDGLDKTRSILGTFAGAILHAHIAEKSHLFSSHVSGPWQEGVSRTLASLCGEGEWLTRYGQVPAGLVTRYQTARKDLDLLRVRQMLVDLNFEYEAYKNPQRDLNKLYWDSFEKYMMLPRHEDISPWAANTRFVVEPAESYSLLLGEIIARQTLAYLAQMNGEVVATTETRAFLVQNYFRFGSRYNWQDLLERGTGETLNPRYLLPAMSN